MVFLSVERRLSHPEICSDILGDPDRPAADWAIRAAAVSAGIVFNRLLNRVNDTDVAKLSPSEREARCRFRQTKSARPSIQSELMRFLNRGMDKDDSGLTENFIAAQLSQYIEWEGNTGSTLEGQIHTPLLPVGLIEVVKGALIRWIDSGEGTGVPDESLELMAPVDVPGQVNKGPHDGLTTTTPIDEKGGEGSCADINRLDVYFLSWRIC
ncbi:hypothetical protein [Bordetella sp. LUAb4]|uniref:hypothetical protein n=1 Tax=Bordetella sp. LUAb4 TaxID=2843195 RepID=UPI001E4C0BA3|nr:hypothetical protein [Bordetella sp. LUAb4]